MAFPTNFGGNPVFRAVLWSLVLHGLLLWPAPLRVSRPSIDPGRGALTARLSGAKASSAPLLESASTSPVLRAPMPRPASRQSGGGVTNREAARPPSSPVTMGVDPEGLRIYRVALAIQARPYWRYPVEAQRAGWSGTAQVRVALLPSGVPAVSLDHSSGHGSLDEAALEMLRAAVRLAEIPDSLRERGFSLVMPVVFEAGSAGGQ